MPAETRIQPETGRPLKRGVCSTVVRYKGLERTVDLPGWYPADGDDGVISGPDARVSDATLREIKAEIGTLSEPIEIRRIRRRPRLSQCRAREVLGGGPRAFQTCESGEVAVGRPLANLLLLLDHKPSVLRELLTDRAA